MTRKKFKKKVEKHVQTMIDRVNAHGPGRVLSMMHYHDVPEALSVRVPFTCPVINALQNKAGVLSDWSSDFDNGVKAPNKKKYHEFAQDLRRYLDYLENSRTVQTEMSESSEALGLKGNMEVVRSAAMKLREQRTALYDMALLYAGFVESVLVDLSGGAGRDANRRKKLVRDAVHQTKEFHNLLLRSRRLTESDCFDGHGETTENVNKNLDHEVPSGRRRI